jgi:hypothetical protein
VHSYNSPKLGLIGLAGKKTKKKPTPQFVAFFLATVGLTCLIFGELVLTN